MQSAQIKLIYCKCMCIRIPDIKEKKYYLRNKAIIIVLVRVTMITSLLFKNVFQSQNVIFIP